MEKLEEARLARLNSQQGREASLIIPIILRGQQTLPLTIRSNRHCYTFERFALSSREIGRNRQFEDRVREIASVIYSHKNALAPLADELTCDCHSFAFPTEEEVRPWLQTMIPSANAFPFR
jgi:chromosome condensin MukBEF complex kleisin-like MukF subunit